MAGKVKLTCRLCGLEDGACICAHIPPSTATPGSAALLAPCPFCNRAMQFRKALHVSDGNVDAIIHAEPSRCPMSDFADGSTDESIIVKWNARLAAKPDEDGVRAAEIVRLIDVLRSDEGDSVTILCDNPDFNEQPNCAIECCGDWTGWLHKRFAADSLLDTLSMAVTERKLPSPREVIAKSNGHHWVKRFNLICCRDCGFIRRTDDQNKPCKGPVGVGIRQDLSTTGHPEHD